MRKNLYTLALLMFILGNCGKEVNPLDVDGISDSINSYEEEIRIEAIMYPADSTAFIRIDRTFSLDEISLYNCLDDDGDWTLDDDLGEDGQEGDPMDEDGDFDTDEPSTGEGNGVPDCGEPHVDEYDEILPHVHLTDSICNTVKIIGPDGTKYLFQYESEGGELVVYPEYDMTIDNAEYYSYGAWIPDGPIEFNLDSQAPVSERIYELFCDCGDWGTIAATDTINLPVTFYSDSLAEEPLLGNIENHLDFLFDLSELLDMGYLSSLGDCQMDNFLLLYMSVEELTFQNFYFTTNLNTSSYWVHASEVSNVNLETCEPHLHYIHAHPSFAPENSILNDSHFITSEAL